MEINGQKQKHTDDLKTNGEKIYEVDKMLFHTRFSNLLKAQKCENKIRNEIFMHMKEQV